MSVLARLSEGSLSEVTASEARLRQFLHGLPGVDQVGAEARAAGWPPGPSRPMPSAGRWTWSWP
jgi:hypothetical protein